MVGTPRHGGIYLPDPLAAKMPEDIVRASFLKSPHWWEEDVDIAWPVAVIGLGSEGDQARARSFLTRYKSTLYAAWEASR